MGDTFSFDIDTRVAYAAIFVFVVGALVVLRFLLKVLKATLGTFGGSKLRKYAKKDAWAVVTGATDGIGKAFALNLAKKGFNILLISRTESRLQETKKEIEDLKVKAEYVQVDFSNATDADYARVAKALEGKTVTVLVNNVGMSYNFPVFFHELKDSEVQDLINMNIVSTTRITRIVLPIMRQQKLGLILNVSSGSSVNTCPLLTVYAATKSYINEFSISLATEYERENIHVECLTPMFITSKMSKIRKPSLTVPTPDTYVKSVLAGVGKKHIHAGYPWHELTLWLFSLVPYNFLRKQAMSKHLGIRKRGLAKLEAKKQQ